MATLAELKKIQTDSTASPIIDPGDPDADPPVEPTLDPAIVAARALLGKIDVAIWKEAQQRLSGVDLPGGNTPEDNQARNEAIGWAQAAIRDTNGQASTALKLLLAEFADLTPAQILGAADAGIETAVNNLIPRLSIGFHPGRR